MSKLAMVIDDCSSGLSLLVRRPLREIKIVAGYDKRQFLKKSRRDQTLLGLPVTIFVGVLSMLAKVILAPFEVWSTLFQKRKLNRSVCLAITAFGCIVFSWMVNAGGGYIANRQLMSIRRSASASVEAKDYRQATELFDSLRDSDVELSSLEQFQHAQALAWTKRGDEANELLNQLAPSSGHQAGYPPAHRFAAISLVRTTNLPYSATTQRVLKWHLDSGRQGVEAADSGVGSLLMMDSEAAKGSTPGGVPTGIEKSVGANRGQFVWQFYFAEARYFESTKQFQAAIKPMQTAAKAWPELYLEVASLCRQIGDRESELAALARARQFLESEVEANPRGESSRIQLARVYLKLANPAMAERQLLLGAEYSPEVFLPQLSRFFLDQWRHLPQSATAEQRLSLLERSIQSDSENVAGYEALIQSYRNLKEEGRALVWQILDRQAARESEMPMPYFAIGILHRLDNQPKQSEAAMETAYRRIDPDRPGFAAVANNLAWLLAHNDQPNLDEAMKLAQLAVDQRPEAGGLRDTLATILMKKGELEPALIQFQKALPTVRDKSAVHQKMAKIYDALDQPKLAMLHRNRAGN